MWIKIFIIVAFIGILISLGSGLFYLVRDKGQTDRTAKALSWRVGLSVGLFAVLMLMAAFGIIKPHGLMPTPPPQPTANTPQ